MIAIVSGVLIWSLAVNATESGEGTPEIDPNQATQEQFLQLNSLDKSYEAPNIDLKAVKVNQDARTEESALEEGTPPIVEMILDSSGSMGQLLNGPRTKMYYSKKLVYRFMLDQWKHKANVGLRVYGARRKNDCKDNELILPHGSSNMADIQKHVEKLFPVGRTPLNDSIRMAVDGIKDYKGPKKIIIFTDGQETCGGDPCKLADQVKKQKNLNIEMFVVAIGFDPKSAQYKAVSCLGDTTVANKEGDLFSALGDVSNKIFSGNNLIVKSPNPLSQVNLYRVENGKSTLYRSFTAAWGIKVPPGEYEAVVNLDPPYRFKPFKIPPGRRVTLVVEGKGDVLVRFRDQLLNIQLLDEHSRVVHEFKSDKPTRALIGRYTLRAFRKPFFEKLYRNFIVAPDSRQELDIGEAGVVRIDTSGLQGFYVYDANDEIVGSYLTTYPTVLKNGNYRIYVNEQCSQSNVNIGGPKDVLIISCDKGGS